MGSGGRWLLVLACAAACAQGSTDTARGSADVGESATTDDASTSTGTMSASSTSPTGSPMNCVPGQQVACACPGGADGAQACLPDGSGYAPCECPNADTGEATGDPTGSSGTAADSESGMGGCGGDCTSCTLCAVQSDCAGEYEACNGNESCQAMINCSIMCGADPTCVDSCSDAMGTMKGFALFEQLRLCVEAVCPMCAGGMG